MKISGSERLRRFYSQFLSHDRVLIAINADPDAIASAMAVKRLLWRRVNSVSITNVNEIKRPDNLAMVRLLNVKMIPFDEVDPVRYNRFIIVDSQPNHHESFLKLKFNVVIDHHPVTDVQAPFMDIRPEYGATASILTEYIRIAKIKPSSTLATGLFHAIKTDTSDFERKTVIEDVRAFQFCYQHANVQLARKIEQSDLRLDFLKYFKQAIQDMRMHRERVFVYLGAVVNPDVCVLIADFFMRVNPVKWSIVFGLYEKKLIIIFRNDGIRKDAGKLAKMSFGVIGSAGGHKSMARAEIPIENLEKNLDLKTNNTVLRWIIDRIENAHKKMRKHAK